MLVGLRNTGTVSVNISFVGGSLVAPSDFEMDTGFASFGDTLQPGAEATLPYALTLHPSLVAAPHALSLSVFYTADGAPQRATAYNATVRLEEPAGGLLDAQNLGMVVLAAAGVGAAAMACMPPAGKGAKGKGGAKGKAAPRVETGTAAPKADAAEWLVGTSLNKKADKAAKKPAAKPAGGDTKAQK